MRANGLIFTSLGWQNSAERPSGAYRIAHYIRKNINLDVEVIDYAPHFTDDQLHRLIQSRIQKNDIKWIGISITWLSAYHTYKRLITLFRQHHPNIKIIVGGQDIYYKDLDADYFINGYGELAVVDALKHAFGDGKIKGIPVNRGWLINALHMYPSYPPENVGGSYSIEYEDRDFLTPNDVLTIELERGCKFQCKYCSYPILGVKGDTSRSEEDMYQELQTNYDKWGVTNYAIADETLNSNDAKLLKLSLAVKRLTFKPNFTGFVRLDLLHTNIAQRELLLESRIWGHYYGVETFNHESGKIVGKGLHPDKNKQTALDVRDLFNKELGLYSSTISMIAGLPRESYDSLNSSASWLKENWMDQNWVFYPLTLIKKISNQDGSIKLSAMGEDFTKYGYREISTPQVDVYGSDQYTLGYAHSIDWVNEYGNRNTADRWSLVNGGDYCNSFVNSWELWGISTYSGSSPADLRRVDLSARSILPHQIQSQICSVANKYIESKLALY